MRWWTPAMRLALIALVAPGLVIGCANVKVWEIRPEATAQAVRDALGERPLGEPDSPSIGLTGPYPPPVPSPLLVQAHMRFDDAGRFGLRSRDEVVRRYVESMALAYKAMSSSFAGSDAGDQSSLSNDACSLYNRALEQFLRLTGGHRFRPDASWCAGLERRGVRVRVRRDGDVWSPERFNELRFAGDYVVGGMDHYYGSDGIGVPLIGIRKPTQDELDHRQGPERFYPYWEVYPVTAVLRFEDPGAGPLVAILELHDTLRFSQIALGGRPVPLAADLTTPTAYHFARGRLSFYERVSLFTPQMLGREAGLHMLHPYERGKIPVVLIHGLGSSPMAWGKVVNELRGDPALRERYQFWMYMYPTGSPFLLSAAELRRSLSEAREAVDPQHTDPAYDQMVLIGHSMGGLLSKLAISDSRDDLWRLNCHQPIDRLIASPENRDLLGRVFLFRPLPFVKRAVFIATPHRGSKLGNELLGRLVDFLIRIPGPLEQAHATVVAQNPPEFFTATFRAGVPSSVDELEFENPYLMAIDHLPVDPGVKAHSIIGKVGRGPLQTSSDGVVPYESAHLDWVESEKIITHNHFCQDRPETIEELRRILFLHLEESRAGR